MIDFQHNKIILKNIENNIVARPWKKVDNVDYTLYSY